MVRAVMDRVFVRLDEEDEKTQGGIIVSPSAYGGERTIGVVESVGEDVRAVKIGDRVLFHVFDELPTFDKSVVVLRENSILGVFEDE